MLAVIDVIGRKAKAPEAGAGNGFVDEAIAHSLTAGDVAEAVRLVEMHRHAAMNQERWPDLQRWDLKQRHPRCSWTIPFSDPSRLMSFRALLCQ